jgi:hypothetical protein
MSTINTWRQFRRRVRAGGGPLLGALPLFPDAILVTGCQRSGTTIMTRVIAGSQGMGRFEFTPDDELDAALILSGRITGLPAARYCFQTTYMYDSHQEYLDGLTRQKMVWVIRNPFSVVFSMLYNWRRFALDELFIACGTRYLTEPYRYRLELFGVIGVPPIRRACLAYRAKMDELFWLRDRLARDALIVVDYDDVVAAPDSVLAELYDRLDVAYLPEYGRKLNAGSRAKADRLRESERALIQSICMPVYERARQLRTIPGGG